MIPWDKWKIISRLEELRKKHGLSFLRTRMSYHKFSNLGEKLNSDCTRKIMKDIDDKIQQDRPCNCDCRLLRDDETCWFGSNCRRSMVVYALFCLKTQKTYIGKTQRYLKKRTMEHVQDVWRVIETGRKKHGENWYGSGGYHGADSFAKHFANLCRECNSYNEVRAKMKKIMEPSIIWQGDRIQCMKTARTMQCKICMVERLEILERFQNNRKMLINDNSDIFSSCKCRAKFHKFTPKVTIEALKTRATQKKVKAKRLSKQRRLKKKKRSSISSCSCCVSNQTLLTPSCHSKVCTPSFGSASTSSSEETASPNLVTPLFLFDTNVPGLPYRSPTLNPTNLELAQVREYENHLDRQKHLEV